MIRFAHVLSALTFGLAPALAATACGHEEAAAPATSAGPASVTDDAILRMTAARCEREVACDHVGDHKRYADKGACEREVKADATSNLATKECGTLVGAEVDKCVLDISGEKCAETFDAVYRVPSCLREKICTK